MNLMGIATSHLQDPDGIQALSDPLSPLPSCYSSGPVSELVRQMSGMLILLPELLIKDSENIFCHACNILHIKALIYFFNLFFFMVVLYSFPWEGCSYQ